MDEALDDFFFCSVGEANLKWALLQKGSRLQAELDKLCSDGPLSNDREHVWLGAVKADIAALS